MSDAFLAADWLSALLFAVVIGMIALGAPELAWAKALVFLASAIVAVRWGVWAFQTDSGWVIRLIVGGAIGSFLFAAVPGAVWWIGERQNALLAGTVNVQSDSEVLPTPPASSAPPQAMTPTTIPQPSVIGMPDINPYLTMSDSELDSQKAIWLTMEGDCINSAQQTYDMGAGLVINAQQILQSAKPAGFADQVRNFKKTLASFVAHVADLRARYASHANIVAVLKFDEAEINKALNELEATLDALPPDSEGNDKLFSALGRYQTVLKRLQYWLNEVRAKSQDGLHYIELEEQKRQ